MSIFVTDTLFLQPTYSCNKSCSGCFAAGTLISTPKGQVPIEQIQDGDLICAYDNSLEEFVITPAGILSRHQSDEVFEIQIGSSILFVTAEHPLLTRRGWVKVQDLTEDDEVLCDVAHIE